MSNNCFRTAFWLLILSISMTFTNDSLCSQTTTLPPDVFTNLLANSCKQGFSYAQENPLGIAGGLVGAYVASKYLNKPINQAHRYLSKTFPTLYKKPLFVAQITAALTASLALAGPLSYHAVINALPSSPHLHSAAQLTSLMPLALIFFNYIFSPVSIPEIWQGNQGQGGQDDKEKKAEEGLQFTEKVQRPLTEQEAIEMYGDNMKWALREIKRENTKEDRQGVQILLHGESGTGKTEFGRALHRVLNIPIVYFKASANNSPLANTKWVGDDVKGIDALEKQVQYYYDQIGKKPLIVFVDECDNLILEIKNTTDDAHKNFGESTNKTFAHFQATWCRERGIILICAANRDLKEANNMILTRFTRDEFRYNNGTGPGAIFPIGNPGTEGRVGMIAELLSRKLAEPQYKNVVIADKHAFAFHLAHRTEGFKSTDLGKTVANIFVYLQNSLDDIGELYAAEDKPLEFSLKPFLFIDLENRWCKKLIDQAIMSSNTHTEPANALEHWEEMVRSSVGDGNTTNLSEKGKKVRVDQVKKLIPSLDTFLHPDAEARQKIVEQLEQAEKNLKDLAGEKNNKSIKSTSINEQRIKELTLDLEKLNERENERKDKFEKLFDLREELESLKTQNFATFAHRHRLTPEKLITLQEETAEYQRIAFSLAQLKDAQNTREQLIKKDISGKKLLEMAKKYAAQFTSEPTINQVSKKKNKLNPFPLNTLLLPLHTYDNDSNASTKYRRKPNVLKRWGSLLSTFGYKLTDYFLHTPYWQVKVTGEQSIKCVPQANYLPFLFKLTPDRSELYRLLGLQNADLHGFTGWLINKTLLLLKKYNPAYQIYAKLTNEELYEQTPFKFIATELAPFITNQKVRCEKTEAIIKEIAQDEGNFTSNTIDEKIAETIMKELGKPTDNLKVSRNSKEELVINGKTTTDLLRKSKKQIVV